jgi:hypothetical protein
MTRRSHSAKNTHRVSEVLSDHGSPLGRLLKQGSYIMQLQHLLAGHMDPQVADHFQVASVTRDRTVLCVPSASWATLLRMQAPSLLGALQQAGFVEIRSIDVRVAPLAEQTVEKRKKKTLSPAAKRALEAMSRLDPPESD